MGTVWKHAIGGILLVSLAAAAAAVPVRVRLLLEESGEPTPAMVCIQSETDGSVRLPPDGRLLTAPDRIEVFLEGIRYNPHPDWVGTVRKMNGQGDNYDRSNVYRLRPSIPHWRHPVAVLVSGDFSIDLPSGRWLVGVEHGMEYVPVDEVRVVSATEENTWTFVLRRWIDLPALGWYSGDVHVHHPILDPAHQQFLLHYAAAEDVYVVNVLEMGDHEGTDFRQVGFGRESRVQQGNHWLVSGQEDPRSTFGHIIGLNLSQMVREVTTYDLYDRTFAGIHRQEGALVGFAHFAWNGCNLPRGFPWYVTTGEIDFVELLQFNTINTLGYYDYLNLGFRLVAAAGSDLPWGSTMGEVRTYVYTGPTLDIDVWFANLKRGQTFVSNGPALFFTVDEQLPGAEIRKPAGKRVRISARAVGHPLVGLPQVLSVIANDGLIRQTANPTGTRELALQIDWRIDESQWLAAGVVCNNGAVAHTTPVYVVVNGRPTWSVRRGPLVIEEQLRAIDGIERELDDWTDARSVALRQRLARARTFYFDLRTQMLSP